MRVECVRLLPPAVVVSIQVVVRPVYRLFCVLPALGLFVVLSELSRQKTLPQYDFRFSRQENEDTT